MHARAVTPPALLLIAARQSGLFTPLQADGCGLSWDDLRGLRKAGAVTHVADRVWGLSSWSPPADPISARLLARARRRAWTVQLRHVAAVSTDDLAAELHQMDGWWSGSARRHGVRRSAGRRPGWRSRDLDETAIVTLDGLRVTTVVQTIIDLCGTFDADGVELLVECALHRRSADVRDLADAASGHGRGLAVLREVLSRRGDGTPPTESMLETLAVQLCRLVPGLPPPRRQVVVRTAGGMFVARVDLAWPELGMFLELDGQHHEGQPVYDAARQTAVVAATGWRPIRLTWTALVDHRADCIRKILDVMAYGR